MGRKEPGWKDILILAGGMDIAQTGVPHLIGAFWKSWGRLQFSYLSIPRAQLTF